MATHIRGTVIASSIAALRQHGVYDAYVEQLDRADRGPILESVPGLWLPIATGVAHYEACDRLRLPTTQLIEIGGHAGTRAMRSPLGVAMKLAKEGGATPWSMLSLSRRFWERSFRGSAIGVFRLGPKEARVELVAWPLARIEYNRVSLRSILQSLAAPFCTRVHVNEVAKLCTPTTCGYKVSWA